MVAPAEDRPAVAVEPDQSEDDRRALDSRTVLRLALLFALVPLVISAVTMYVTVGNSYHPYGDWAGMEMRVRDVGHHPVLIGLYSRDGWSHPGAILFYLLAVPYRLTGDSAVGLQLGALFINGAAIVGMALVARRRGGTPLLLCTLLGIALLARTLGPHFMRDPWVCYSTVIPFALMMLLSWSMTCGDTWALPVGAGVASYLAQTHVGYVALAFPLLAWGAVALGWRAVRRHRSGDATQGPAVGALVRAAVISAVLVVVLWLPPLIDQVFQFHSPGNLSRIVEWFQKGKSHTLAQGARVVGAQFGLSPEWLTHRHALGLNGETLFLYSAPMPVLLVPLVVAGFVLWRRRATEALLLLATVSLGLVLGVIAVSRIVGIVYVYRLQWTWVLAMLAFVVVAWTGWMVIAARSPRGGRRLVGFGLCALGVLSLVNSVSAARAVSSRSTSRRRRYWRGLNHRSSGRCRRGRGDVIIRATSPGAGFYKSGLVLRLERDGIRSSRRRQSRRLLRPESQPPSRGTGAGHLHRRHQRGLRQAGGRSRRAPAPRLRG